MGDSYFYINVIYTIQKGTHYILKDISEFISISERDLIHFNKAIALSFFEIIGLDIENIQIIKYYDDIYKGWINLSDEEIELKKIKIQKFNY